MTWTRRQFIKTGLIASAGFLISDSLWLEKYFIETKEFYLGKSDRNKFDIKVVQISDLHIRTLNSQLIQLTKKLNQLNPDLILITGDSVDDPKNLHLLNKFLKLIDGKIKKVAILGNWEYWGNIDLPELKYTYEDNNCDLLINSSATYHFRGKSISITGLDDFVGGHADMYVVKPI